MFFETDHLFPLPLCLPKKDQLPLAS